MKLQRLLKLPRFDRSILLPLGMLSALLVPFAISIPTQAQTTGNIVADGRLDEYYSANTAPVLYAGLIGPAVADVQYFLLDQGFYSGEADSVFGSATYDAVVAFQRSNNLVADGVVGPETWAVLFAVDERVAFLRPSEPLL